MSKDQNSEEKSINFFITSDTFPSISVTGNVCSLMCKHCKGKQLQSLICASTSEDLEKKALIFFRNGAKGILLTGGCDERGCVPIKNFIPAIKRIKQDTDMILIAHTGFISYGEANLLKDSGLDGIGFDVMGDMKAVSKVYGLSASEEEYMDCLKAISDSGLSVFPHVCVGINFGKLSGEFRSLEMIRSINPSSVIITGLIPLSGTPMKNTSTDPSDFEKVIRKAVAMFPDIPVVLGCAHSKGKDRAEIEKIALSCGITGIAAPTLHTIKLAKKIGLQINYYGSCCGLIPDENMRIYM